MTKEKLQEWYDQTYFKITHLSVKRFWNNIKRWVSYYKVIRNTYDFDYTSLLEIELHQLIKLRDCISKYQSSTRSWFKIRNMNWTIACLQIILEDGCSYSNEEPPFFIEGPDEKGYHKLIPNPEHKYIMPIYVNTRNVKRFWKGFDNSEMSDLQKDCLRLKKAWELYNNIRKEHIKDWWD